MLIDEHRGRLPAKRMCELPSLSRSAYYNWFFRVPTKRIACPKGDLYKEIEAIVVEFPGYGYRRVTAELKRQGHRVNHKKVLRIMSENSPTKTRKRNYTRTTDSTHGLPVYPNLAKESPPTGINELWVADIIYIRL